MTIMATRPRAGLADEMTEDDNQRGPMPDETECHQLVRHLVADGDDRAQSAGRHARRTLAEMAPGYEQQPVLRLTGPLTFRSADDACAICGFWKCICGFPSVSAVSDRAVIR
ncbi:hypothetical protein OOK39_45030 [Streptomyces sp. NBC_00264]|nr:MULTISPECIES: hypothetical protein [unclassified Streptomyces]MCX5166204.1 hypothetical protein [Streptomyces sp. NBC_00305]MCX5224721.1 hypothetical protein [Streptomyces sp. NBC_00264]WSG56682.1 hypothetical protein OHA38_44115 [Streptomyces sp. NBC_01732]